MILKTGKFKIQRIADTAKAVVLEQDGLVIGRLQSCDVQLNHKSVSRIHAGINFVENTYFLINLSVSNSVTLNGHLLASRAADVLADGDIIQIGPFAITVAREEDTLSISVSEQFSVDLRTVAENLPAEKSFVAANEDITDV